MMFLFDLLVCANPRYLFQDFRMMKTYAYLLSQSYSLMIETAMLSGLIQLAGLTCLLASTLLPDS